MCKSKYHVSAYVHKWNNNANVDKCGEFGVSGSAKGERSGVQQALDDVSFSNGFKENPQKDFLASSDIKLTTRWGPIFAFLSHATVTLSSFGAPNC